LKTTKNKFHTWTFKAHYVTDKDEVPGILKKIPVDKLCGLDIETAKKPEYVEHTQAGLDPRLSNIRLLQVHTPDRNIYVFDLFKIPIKLLAPFLSKGRFVAHCAVFEIVHLTHAGILDINCGCSMLLSQLLEGAEYSPYEPDEEDDEDKTGLAQYRTRGGHSLDAVTQRLFGVKVSKTQQVSDWAAKVLSQDQIVYAALDALLTYEAALVLSKKIVEYKMTKAYQQQKEIQHVVARMQLEGLPIDWKYHKNLIAGWEKQSALALEKCKPFFGDTNMKSGKQMNEWLKVYLKDSPKDLLAWPKTKKGQFAFGKNVITAYAHLPSIAALLEYKQYSKLIDTYGQSLIEKKHPITGRLHTSYTIGETRTSRLSSRNPNNQNFPRDKAFRNMFVADKDHVLVVSDFSQIELRLQAEFSRDPVMCAAYRDKEDIYCTLGSSLFGRPITKKDLAERFSGKICMLALGYGMGPAKFQQYCANVGIIKPFEFFQKAHKTYHSMFRVYSSWCNKIRKRTEQLGYIETLLGKRRKLTETELYTRGPNTVIQGSAAELMMRALVICHKRIHGIGVLIATVHDEILLHVHKKHADKAKDILAASMNDAMKELFPNAVSHEVADAACGLKWGDIKAEL